MRWITVITPLVLIAFFKCGAAESTTSNDAETTMTRKDHIERPSRHHYSDAIFQLNQNIKSNLTDLLHTVFFRYYRVNLQKPCRFWPELMRCSATDCSVHSLPEDEIPEMWQRELGDVQMSSGKDKLFFQRCEYTDKDFCVLDDMSSTNREATYVDLHENPERFTGYSGNSAQRVWKSIYEENCFKFGSSPNSPPLLDANNKDAALSGERMCLEQRVFYRLISGLHASISVHLSFDFFNRTTSTWGPNLAEYMQRVGLFPERRQNIYFAYMVYVRALNKIAPYLKHYEFCTGNAKQDARIGKLMKLILRRLEQSPVTFDEQKLFAGKDAPFLKEEFKLRFRNISRIMDCVGCEKCRLWGKLQVSGLGTALKVLFSYAGYSGTDYQLQRNEIVALLNGFGRLSKSIESIQHFEQLWNEQVQSEKEPVHFFISWLQETDWRLWLRLFSLLNAIILLLWWLKERRKAAKIASMVSSASAGSFSRPARSESGSRRRMQVTEVHSSDGEDESDRPPRMRTKEFQKVRYRHKEA